MTQEPAAKNNRWLKPILIVSLCANLLVVGAVASFWVAGNHKPVFVGGSDGKAQRSGPGLRGGDYLVSSVLRSMDRSERRAFGRQLKSGLDGAGLTKQQSQEARANLANAIAAEPFDPDLVMSVLSEIRGVHVQRSTVVHARVIELMQGMSADQRKEIAASLVSRRGKKKN